MRRSSGLTGQPGRHDEGRSAAVTLFALPLNGGGTLDGDVDVDVDVVGGVDRVAVVEVARACSPVVRTAG
ncbi:MAG TPA: hypothetical protein VHT97_03125 [Acidimicrobiales bacterium]|jgi:hypothetical protein|nr:hypothetical protein [Acidimicrobiales bacterium]